MFVLSVFIDVFAKRKYKNGSELGKKEHKEVLVLVLCRKEDQTKSETRMRDFNAGGSILCVADVCYTYFVAFDLTTSSSHMPIIFL